MVAYAATLIRPIDKRIDGFDNREADRAKEKNRSELATKYSPEVVDYFIAQGEASGLFANIGKINSGFYNSEDKSLDNLINLSLTGIIDRNPYKKIEAPAGPTDVNISDIKDTSLGAAVANVNASLKRIVDNAPDDKKAAASDIYTLVTGGPMGFVTGKAIEQGVKLLPNPVLQTIGQTSEDINNYLGVAGTGVLLGLSPDQIKASQESGNKQTQDRVEGTAMVGGAALDVVVGAVTAGAAGVLITKAKKSNITSKNEVNDNPGKEDSEMVGQHQVPVWTTKPEIETLLRNQNVKLKDDWNVDRIYSDVLQVEKGHRPDPSEYLSPEYIAKHLAEFDEGISRFMPKKNLDKYGPAQSDGTSFVMPRKEAEKILREAGGDPRKLEAALGLKDGSLSGTQLVRLDFNNPHELGVKIPSGNEAGANPQWIPGGRLPKGNVEGVINVPKNGNVTWTEQILEF